MNRPTYRDLRGLRAKYERILSLRVAHARARDDASFVEPDPRPEMADLAAEYPGSLREIDRLPFDVIVERIRALRGAERHPSGAATWMIAQVAFHRYARGALVTKRWLAGRKRITPAIRASFVEATMTLPRGDDARLLVSELDAIANPPRGRLLDVVHAKVARELGVTEGEARALVFGDPGPTHR